MFHGLRRVSQNKTGLTLVEIMVSVLLMVVVFLGVSALYVASQQLFFRAHSKVLISYEFQYAVEHIYKNVMLAVGDETAAPGSRSLDVPDDDPTTLYITANTNDPITSAKYSDTVTYKYSKSGEDLMFDNGSGPEPIVPKISVTDVSFALSGNILTIELTGSYRDQSLTFYSACYPQLASFR